MKDPKRKRKPPEAELSSANPAAATDVPEVDLRDVTVAYLLIKVQLGRAAEVAAAVSGVKEIRWAVVITGPYDVLAGVRVPDNDALEEVVTRVGLIPGVANPLTSVMTSYYQDGAKKSKIWNGPP